MIDTYFCLCIPVLHFSKRKQNGLPELQYARKHGPEKDWIGIRESGTAFSLVGQLDADNAFFAIRRQIVLRSISRPTDVPLLSSALSSSS